MASTRVPVREPAPSTRPPRARDRIPLLLTLLRAALAPVMVLLALYSPSRTAFGVCLVAAFLSDVFDGVIARALGVATATLRRLDSVADTAFYVGATYAVWHLHPAVLATRGGLLAALLGLELARYLFDAWTFRREASYHLWSSKLWGIALCAAFLAVLCGGLDDALVDAALWIGIVADLEGLAVSAVLPAWQTDVPTLAHALRCRHRG